MNAVISTSTALHNAIGRNPHLAGLQCLRCDGVFPLARVHTGCPACAAGGVYVSLRARYNKVSGITGYLPYENGIKFGEGLTPLVDAPVLARAANVGRDTGRQRFGALEQNAGA